MASSRHPHPESVTLESISSTHRVRRSVVEASHGYRPEPGDRDDQRKLIDCVRPSPRFSRDPGGGRLAKEAASHLVNKLACALDSALTDWRRETLDHAIADVKAFVAQKEDVARP